MKAQLVNENFTENYMENLLHSYEITNISDYINPSDDYIQASENLDNIDKGADLLINILENQEKIMLIVDSDVDGYTSSAIIYLYIKKMYPLATIDILLHEGKQHGLEDHIDWLEKNQSEKKYSLVICPDSSSNDFEYHERLAKIGIQCLVLDHHETDVPISDNAIVINNQLSNNYLNKDLTGAGIVYQFCRYVDKKFGCNYADNFIDLAALGIDGDMGSLLSYENRYIIKKGFDNVQNFFFQTLIEKQSYSMGGRVNPISVAFYIVPLINAMIRVGTMEEKERLFMAFVDGKRLIPSNKRGAKGTEELVAIESARECTNARNHQNKALDKAVEELEAKIFKYDLLENKVLFIRLEEEDFPPVLNGLIAMKLAAKYKKPTIVARLNDEGYIRGSMRGINQSELVSFKDFLTQSGMFEYVQGHANAAGASIKNSYLGKFHEYANEVLKNYNFNESVYDVNFIRDGADVDLEYLIRDIDNYKDIWGTNVPEPRIYVKNIKVNQTNIQIMGAHKDTLKITYGGIAYMKFHAKDMIEELHQKNELYGVDRDLNIEVIGRANVNHWNNYITNQIFIDSWEITNDLLQF